MADREKVISKLQILRTWCAVNPNYGKGLEPEDCTGMVSVLDDALALLKEQEAVKPIVGYGCYICGVCKNPLNSASQKFCSECGKAVKWND